MHRSLIAGLVASMWALACADVARDPAPVEHVVLVTLDTLRADHLPTYGYPRATAPFLDSLASRGVVFERALSASSHTTPSHGSLMTGLYPYQHGAIGNGNQWVEGVEPVASLLGEAGFETAGFVSVRFLEKLDRGFESFDRHGGVATGSPYRFGALTTDTAIAWLGKRQAERRLFLWVHLFDAHDYLEPSSEHALAAAVLDADSELDSDGAGALLERLHGVAPERHAHRNLPAKLLEYDIRVRYLDLQLERLYEAVEAAVGDASVLWVVTADHGEALGDHGYVGHGKFLYEEQLRVPLVIYASDGRLSRRRVPELVRHVDLTPTLLEMAGVEVPSAIEGRSLSRYLEGPAGGEEPSTSFAQRRPAPAAWGGRAARGDAWSLQDERYKWLVYSQRGDELYDLTVDPLERDNLAAAPPPGAGRLRAELRRRLAAARAAGGEPAGDEHLEELRALGYVD